VKITKLEHSQEILQEKMMDLPLKNMKLNAMQLQWEATWTLTLYQMWLRPKLKKVRKMEK